MICTAGSSADTWFEIPTHTSLSGGHSYLFVMVTCQYPNPNSSSLQPNLVIFCINFLRHGHMGWLTSMPFVRRCEEVETISIPNKAAASRIGNRTGETRYDTAQKA